MFNDIEFINLGTRILIDTLEARSLHIMIPFHMIPSHLLTATTCFPVFLDAID